MARFGYLRIKGDPRTIGVDADMGDHCEDSLTGIVYVKTGNAATSWTTVSTFYTPPLAPELPPGAATAIDAQATNALLTDVMASVDKLHTGSDLDPIRTDPTGATVQPVSAQTLPLPDGAATEATMRAVAAGITSQPAVWPVSAAALPLPTGAAADATLQAIANLLTAQSVGTDLQPVRTDPTGATAQPVTVADLPLPVGASSEATLTAIRALLPAGLVGGRLDVNVGSAGAPLQVFGQVGYGAPDGTPLATPLRDGSPTQAVVDATVSAQLDTVIALLRQLVALSAQQGNGLLPVAA